MKTKTLVLIIFSFLLGLCTFYFLEHIKQIREEAKRQDTLTFSNTQTWEPYFLESAQSVTDTETYVLPPPPANSSRETKKDLATLHDYQDARTEENILEIKREILIDNAFFGDETYASLVDEIRRPRTSLLMAYVAEFEFAYIMEIKQQFNRVRPTYLDPTLIPAIEVPRHPAYPSGHATQAHLRAFIFAELDPENRNTYIESADRIARNREIAGVHYPSDSKAGVILATQLFETLMQNTDFVTLMENAKTEW